MNFQRVEVKTFSQATEDPEKVLRSLQTIVTTPFEPTVEKTFGHFKNPIQVFTVHLKGKKGEEFLSSLVSRLLPSDIERLASEIGERFVDGKLYIRLDKMSAYEGAVALGEGIQLIATVTSYPFDEEHIKKELRGLLA